MAAVGKVLVQGAGIGGLVFAAALGQRGVEVDVVEATGPEDLRGIGLSQPSNALAALGEIGVRDACIEAGFPFEPLVFWNPAGEQVALIPPPESRYGTPSNNAIGRPVLHAILQSAAEAAGCRIRTGITIAKIIDDADGVDVRFGTWAGRNAAPVPDDADTDRYDLVVGFDGARSQVRTHLFGDRYVPQFAGSGAWRITFPRLPQLEFISVTSNGPMRALLTPISQEQMYLGVITREPGNPHHDRADFARLVTERLAGFAGPIGELRDAVTEQHPINYTALEHVVVREPWYRGRVAIAGDAAHTSTPYLAQGAAMAAEDAVVLAQELDRRTVLADALHAWYARRRDRALFVADLSLALLRQEQGAEPTPEEAELLAIGIPGAQVRLSQEAY
jgi:2-polyprenyl-6-methoxyphenol hydroxylase-like FAD-dependent oxidoreductase